MTASASSGAAGSGLAGAGAAMGDADLLAFDLLMSAAGQGGSHFHIGIGAPDLLGATAAGSVALSAPSPQVYGYGLISVNSDGTGTTMAYEGGATFAFRAGSTENLFLDFGPFGMISMFESLSFRAVLNGIDLVNQTFDNPVAANDFFGRQHALGVGRDGSDSELSLQYRFLANAPYRGFTTLYALSNIPVAPFPVPAALPLLLAALADLRLRARRAA